MQRRKALVEPTLGRGLISKVECERVPIVGEAVTLKAIPFLLVCDSLFVRMATLERHRLLIPGEAAPRHLCVTKDELYVAEVLVHLKVWMHFLRWDWKLQILTGKTALPLLQTPVCVEPKLPPEEMARVDGISLF